MVSGEGVSANILRLAREGLRVPLTSALHQAAATKESVTYAGAPVKTNGERQTINLSVRLLPETEAARDLMLVQFHEVEPPLKLAPAGETETGRVAELEHELQATREYLQATIEELEVTSQTPFRPTHGA